MTISSRPRDIDELWTLLKERLGMSGYAGSYGSESAFEDDVWTRVVVLADEIGVSVAEGCLTSHVDRAQRSAAAWERFCREPDGPDVTVLGSRNRLDIVVRAPCGSIGIEVKSFGEKGHAAKLTQGLGQALLALAHRDRTILVIHCGPLGPSEQAQLRTVGDKITDRSRTALIVAP